MDPLKEIQVDENDDRLVVNETIISELKSDIRRLRQQVVLNYYICMNWIRIVQEDNVEHFLKIIPHCPADESVLSDFCFVHPTLDRHWHYEIKITKIQPSGVHRVVEKNESPTWKSFSYIEDGAQLFLLKLADSN